MMLKRIIHARLRAFERRYAYDAAYLHELLAVDAGALMRVARLNGMSRYRRDVPPGPWFAAKIVAAMHEDCGPCTQLVVRMAEEAGVDQATLAAVVAGDDGALGEDVRLAVRFTRASLAHDLEADALREAARARWGPRGVASLALAVAAGRVYPTLKYLLGHGHACARVVVGGAAVVPGAVARAAT